uniref:Uncharacterized protein n=1 Tax=Ascaris lumbricoides TaxID=6252 RepID=A0A0M3II36_ASCLU
MYVGAFGYPPPSFLCSSTVIERANIFEGGCLFNFITPVFVRSHKNPTRSRVWSCLFQKAIQGFGTAT